MKQDAVTSLLQSTLKKKMKKVTKQKLKVVSSLELHADYYSLVYFGFWLDSDEEELSSYKQTENNYKNIIIEKKQSDSSSSDSQPDDGQDIEIGGNQSDGQKGSDNDESEVGKDWIL